MGQAPAAADTLLKGEGLPDYQAITPEAVSQGMPWLLHFKEEMAKHCNVPWDGNSLFTDNVRR